MSGVSDPEYRRAVHRFSSGFLETHRAAGEPTYDEVARRLAISPASVHRYLNGVILPRWQVVAAYLEAFRRELGEGVQLERELKARWIAARDVLKPVQNAA